jgi:hypothetical protein
MATYLYETIPADPSAAPERFEIQQSMKDDALIRHPASGYRRARPAHRHRRIRPDWRQPLEEPENRRQRTIRRLLP